MNLPLFITFIKLIRSQIFTSFSRKRLAVLYYVKMLQACS